MGSTNILTDRSGALVDHYEYYAFGKTRYDSGACTFKVSNRYTDQILDDDTGLYYYNARYYDAELGRFIQPDSIVQSPFDPQTLNRYSYCNNNPLNYIDPSGYFLKTIWKKFTDTLSGFLKSFSTVFLRTFDSVSSGILDILGIRGGSWRDSEGVYHLPPVVVRPQADPSDLDSLGVYSIGGFHRGVRGSSGSDKEWGVPIAWRTGLNGEPVPILVDSEDPHSATIGFPDRGDPQADVLLQGYAVGYLGVAGVALTVSLPAAYPIAQNAVFRVTGVILANPVKTVAVTEFIGSAASPGPPDQPSKPSLWGSIVRGFWDLFSGE